MAFLLSFLEGIITFVSPCLLPMLPVYLSYFAGQSPDEKAHTSRTLISAFGFVLGFSIFFIVLGAFAGQLGEFLQAWQTTVNIVCGTAIALFGLHYMGFLSIPFLGRTVSFRLKKIKSGFLPSMLLGMVFSVSWTPCVGAFLGSALMMAAQSGSSFTGLLMLLAFSAGLGIPFIISALLIDRLKGAFDLIKRHYRLVTLVSGLLLVVLGLLVATGAINYFYNMG